MMMDWLLVSLKVLEIFFRADVYYVNVTVLRFLWCLEKEFLTLLFAAFLRLSLTQKAFLVFFFTFVSNAKSFAIAFVFYFSSFFLSVFQKWAGKSFFSNFSSFTNQKACD